MSMFEKFFKNKKGISETPEEKPSSPKTVQNDLFVIPARAILSDGKMYDTSKANKIIFEQKKESFYGTGIYRTYFVTENGRYFSAEKTMSLRKSYNLQKNTEIQTIYVEYDDLRIESELAVKEIIGKNNVELYKELFGEVEEA